MKIWAFLSPLSVLRALRAWFSRSIEFVRRHQDLLALSLVFGVARVLSSLFTQLASFPYGPTIGLFLQQAQNAASGAYPFINFWAAYPPAFPWILVAAYRLSLLIPAWGNGYMWFGTIVRWAVVPFEVGTLALVYALSVRCNPGNSMLRSVFMYAAAFVTLYVPLGWFDVLPLFWVLLALYFVLSDQAALTGISIGLGMLAKPLTPLVLPAAWQRLTSLKARVLLIATSIATFVFAMLPLVIASPTMVLAHWRNVLSRPSWETVWALLDGYYGPGMLPPVDQRFDPSAAILKNHTGGSYGLWALLAFGLLGLFLWTRRIDWRDARRTIAFVGLTWCLFSLWSKGYSPQWAINFIPFIALLLPNLRGAVYLSLMAVVLVAEWPVAFMILGNQPAFLAAVIIWRTALFILLSFEFGAIALAGQATRYWPKIFWAATGVLIVSAVAIGNDGFSRYAAQQLAKEPLNDTIQMLQKEASPQTGLICRDLTLCERLTPYLPGLATFWLPATSTWQTSYLPAFAQSHPVLWLIVDTNQDLSIEQYLSERYAKESQTWSGGMRLARFIALDQPSAPGQPGAQTAEATFGCCLQLKSYSLRSTGTYLSLKLNWLATAPVATSYKLFVHVYNAAGDLLVQNDQFPVGEFLLTNAWVAGQTVSDLHGLSLSEPIHSGDRLSIGWYDPASGQRLPLAGSASDAFDIVVP
jgi:hypothetical protein